MITAFGETKSHINWIKDPRCMVKLKTLNWRLSHGWDSEEAISKPTNKNRGEKVRIRKSREEIEEAINSEETLSMAAQKLRICYPTLKKLMDELDIQKPINTSSTTKLIDITNQTFKFLTVIERNLNYKGPGSEWKCRCVCGKITNARSDQLRNGRRTSCGCHGRTGYDGIIPGHFYSRFKDQASIRKYEWSIDYDYLCNLWIEQNGICALTGLQLELPRVRRSLQKGEWTASLDRKDSKKGYIPGNVQWIHKKVNRMKQDYTDEEFIYFCTLISEHNKETRI